MSGFAQISVIGNVGKDPELRHTQNGAAVASFSLAYTERWNSNGERNERTTWFRVDAWSNDGADKGMVKVIRDYVRKGSQIMVQGQPVIEEFTDKDDVRRQVFKIKLGGPNSVLRLLGQPGGQNREGSSVERKTEKEGATDAGQTRQREPAMADDDIPF